ncbi:MAG: tRNA pseudouridine(38-40) synthase TruA [Tannerella sp.]|jgi:tRNA pseudouridine38-40 synthase|nr:tRNA pseudouridine(38-40) synthase TruA [Tannerella sp.]
MNRYFIYLAYKGTRYCGWQNQPNGVSIQQCVEEALSKVLRQTISVTGAGRTDAGVHARMMVAHFDVLEGITNPDLLTEKLNKMLPEDISIHKITRVTINAHTRFDALSRTYIYRLSEKKNPFEYEYFFRTSLKTIRFDRMNEACSVLFDYSDFTSFSKLHTDAKTNLCRIDVAEWTKTDDRWVFTIKADRFLRNMVRSIVGTLLDVGRYKLTINEFRDIIEAKNRCRAGMSVDPQGLTLVDIEYPDHLFLDE